MPKTKLDEFFENRKEFKKSMCSFFGLDESISDKEFKERLKEEMKKLKDAIAEFNRELYK